jgi:hypothetical protein
MVLLKMYERSENQTPGVSVGCIHVRSPRAPSSGFPPWSRNQSRERERDNYLLVQTEMDNVCAPRSQSAIFRSGLLGLGSSAPLTERGKVRKSKRYSRGWQPLLPTKQKRGFVSEPPTTRLIQVM